MESGQTETTTNFGMDDLRLIDFSTEDDYLVTSLPDNDGFDGLWLSVNSENRREQPGIELIWNQTKQEPKAAESMEQKREETKSSSFFTSEELFVANKGFGKEDNYLLYKITEDMKRSPELSCLLDSSRLSSGNLEIDLFDDIRVSIEKSSEAFKKRRRQRMNASKKVGIVSQKRMIESASRRQSFDVQKPDKTKKDAYVKSQKDIQSGGLSSTLSDRISGQIRPMLEGPTKRGSLGVNHIKIQNKATGGAKKMSSRVSKRSGCGDPNAAVSGTTPYSDSCSSLASPSSSVSSVKTFSNFLRKKLDLGNPRVPSRGSKIEIPKKNQTDNKAEVGNSSTSTSASPATSTDRCSWKSSSSASATRESYINSMPSVNTIDFKAVSSHCNMKEAAARLQRPPGYDTHFENDCQETGLPKGRVSTAKDVTKYYKAYGHQMPSQKMEFLDEPMTSTPDGKLHFHTSVQSCSPRIGTGFCSPHEGANGEPQPFKTSSENDSVLHNPHKTGVICPAAPEAYGFGLKRSFTGGSETIMTNLSINAAQENFKNNGKVVSVDHEAAKPAHRGRVRPEDKAVEEYFKSKLGEGRNTKINGRASKPNHEDAVNMLSRHVCALNFGGDVIIDLKGKKKSRCRVQSGPKSTKNYRDSQHDFHSPSEPVQSTRTPLMVRDSLCNIMEGNVA